MTELFKSTVAATATCERCRAALLVAQDEGLTARVDATPLPDRQAEINALLNGQWTYTYSSNRHLIIRTPERISGGMLRGTIHPEHKCNGPTQLTLDDLMGTK